MLTNGKRKACAAVLIIFLQSIAAGAMIAIGSAIYVNVSNKVVGAIFFSIGLTAILMLGYNLFTGAVGYAKSKLDFVLLFVILAGNFVGSILCKAWGNEEAAIVLWQAKLDKPLFNVLWQSILCGMLVYIAVAAFKGVKAGWFPIVVFAVSGFILAGGEHSIADMCYMFAANALSWNSIKFLLVVVLGNTIGARVMGCKWGVAYLNELLKD